MDKNKQKKKKKSNIKIISASLLVIILVSMLAVPTSAVEGDSLVGTWIISPYTPDSWTGSAVLVSVKGSFNFYSNGSLTNKPLDYIELYDGYFSSEPCYIILKDVDSQGYTTSSTAIDGDKVRCASLDYTDTESFYTDLRTFTIEEVYSQTTSQGYIDLVQFLETYGEKASPPPPNPLENILDVFLGIGGWIVTAVTSLIVIFYSAEAGKLTVIGVLSVASLAISVIFLLIGVIQNFMHFRS